MLYAVLIICGVVTQQCTTLVSEDSFDTVQACAAAVHTKAIEERLSGKWADQSYHVKGFCWTKEQLEKLLLSASLHDNHSRLHYPHYLSLL